MLALPKIQGRDPRPVQPEQLARPESVAIVGGGVAGLSAALWCWRLGCPAVVIDPGPLLGGQLPLVHFKMRDLPGRDPLSGHALARHLRRQFTAHQGRWAQARLISMRADAEACQLELGLARLCAQHPITVRARTAVLATGVRRRCLGVPGETELLGQGILPTASEGIRHLRGQRVLVVGGGDAACENALKLARAAAEVMLCFRRQAVSARSQLRQQVEAHPRIRLLPQTQIARFVGQRRLECVQLLGGENLGVSQALIRVGWLPNSECLPRAWLDERGYVACDARLRVAGQQRVFVAGDLRAPAAPSVSAAQGDGACAAKAAVLLLEA